MSIFHRIPADELAAEFAHKGWLGLCPVWICDRDWKVTERNWIPEWWMWANLAAQDLAAWCVAAMGGIPPDGWPVRITGALGDGGKP